MLANTGFNLGRPTLGVCALDAVTATAVFLAVRLEAEGLAAEGLGAWVCAARGRLAAGAAAGVCAARGRLALVGAGADASFAAFDAFEGRPRLAFTPAGSPTLRPMLARMSAASAGASSLAPLKSMPRPPPALAGGSAANANSRVQERVHNARHVTGWGVTCGGVASGGVPGGMADSVGVTCGRTASGGVTGDGAASGATQVTQTGA